MTARERHDLLAGGALFLGGAVLYAAFLTEFYVFEGLARAMPIELGRFADTLNGNYLLYGPLGWCFHHLLGALGVQWAAVRSLQTLDALLGGAGLAALFAILRVAGLERRESALWAACLGGTLGWAMWSTDAENYVFSAVLLQLNFLAGLLYAEKKKGSPLLLGALHALALGGHVVNGIFGAVHLFWIHRRHRERWWKPARAYGWTFALAAGGLYFLALIVIQPDDPVRWFLGSAAADDGGMRWRGWPAPWKLWEWIKMSARIFTSFEPDFAPAAAPAWSAVPLWGARLLLAGLAWSAFAKRPRDPAWTGALVWLGAYAAVFTSWEPHTMVYRVSDLAPAMIVLALARPPRRAVAALAACLLLGNFAAEIAPRAVRANNPDLARMDRMRERTPEGAWIAGDGGRDELYIPYFARRRPLVIGRYKNDPRGLDRLIGGLLENGQDVYVTREVLRIGHWRAYFAGWPLTPEGDGLFRLRPPLNSATH